MKTLEQKGMLQLLWIIAYNILILYSIRYFYYLILDLYAIAPEDLNNICSVLGL